MGSPLEKVLDLSPEHLLPSHASDGHASLRGVWKYILWKKRRLLVGRFQVDGHQGQNRRVK